MKKKSALKKELKQILGKYRETLNWFEEGELRSWVDSGNSPFDNPESIIHEDGSPFDFVEWHRSARWVCAHDELTEESNENLLHYYTDLGIFPGPPAKDFDAAYFQSAQIFLCGEISYLRTFIEGKNLLEDYMRYRYPEPSEEELPFL